MSSRWGVGEQQAACAVMASATLWSAALVVRVLSLAGLLHAVWRGGSALCPVSGLPVICEIQTERAHEMVQALKGDQLMIVGEPL